jgi:AraC-like DNA-binding protein
MRGSRLRSRPGPTCVPEQAAFAQGKKFRDEKATQSQEGNLRRLITRHLHRKLIAHHRDYTVPTLAAVFGRSERWVQQLLGEVRKKGRNEDVEFAAEVMRSMLINWIAGVLGTRRTQENRAAFRTIRGVSELQARLSGYGGDFREWKAAFDHEFDLWERK